MSDAKESRTPWAVLYDAETGHAHAGRIADQLGLDVQTLAGALHLSYAEVRDAPSALAHQAALRPVVQMLEMVRASLPDDATRRAWLHRRRSDLEDASPLDVVLAGEVGAVVSLLEGVQSGMGAMNHRMQHRSGDRHRRLEVSATP